MSIADMHRETWVHDPWSETRIYVATEGYDSEVITNHLSVVRFEVVMGSGYVATNSMAEVSEGDAVTIPPKTPYQYGGDMETMISIKPGVMNNLVTFGSDKLSKENKRILAAVEGRDLRSAVRRTIITPTLEAVHMLEEFITSAQESS